MAGPMYKHRHTHTSNFEFSFSPPSQRSTPVITNREFKMVDENSSSKPPSPPSPSPSDPIIKTEPTDEEDMISNIKPEPMDTSPPMTTTQPSISSPSPSNDATDPTSYNLPMEIEGIPFTFQIKSVDEYLAEGPTLPVKRQVLPTLTTLQNLPSIPLPSGVISNESDPVLVVGTTTTTNNISELNEMIQRKFPSHQIIEWVFTEPYQQLFTCKLKWKGLDDLEAEYDIKPGDDKPSPKLFPNKKLAKSFIAGLAIEKLKSLPEANEQPEHIVVGPGKSGGVSSLGELNGFFSQNRLERPIITDTSNSKAPFFFGCEITITIDGYGTLKFGDGNPKFANKGAARNSAAKEALDWLEKTKPIIIVKKGRNSRSRCLAPGSKVEINATGKTIGEVATEACTMLGFKAPIVEKESVPLMTGMYNVYVTLEHNENTSKVGPIKNVYGKKNAGEEAMRATLKTVQLIAERRMGVSLSVTGQVNFSLFQ